MRDAELQARPTCNGCHRMIGGGPSSHRAGIKSMRDGGRERIPRVCIFFFQAEDGIRYWSVTGVQTCALPISGFPGESRSLHREINQVYMVDLPVQRPTFPRESCQASELC